MVGKLGKSGWLVPALALVAAVGSSGIALAQQSGGAPEVSFEAVAFDAADTDGDGFVSEAELTRDAAHGFATLDRNGRREAGARASWHPTIRRCSRRSTPTATAF